MLLKDNNINVFQADNIYTKKYIGFKIINKIEVYYKLINNKFPDIYFSRKVNQGIDKLIDLIFSFFNLSL